MSEPAPAPLHGHNPAAAVDHIRARAEAWKADPGRPDGRKLALVVEGGSMRGVLSGGGVVALGRLGFGELFDEVFATSAGVMNASYLLAGQAELGIRVYYEDLTDRRFWSPRRFWKMLDVDYVFRDVVARVKRLDVDAVFRNRGRLLVAAINARDGVGAILDTRATTAPLLQVLKAATAMPILYNRTVEVDGVPYVDGGLAIPFPLRAAIDRGCTDVLVMLTRPPGYRPPEPTVRQRLLFRHLVTGNKRKMAELYRHHAVVSRQTRALALGEVQPDRAVNIVTVCPEPPELIHRTTRDPATLRAGAVEYGRRVLRLFGADDPAWTLGMQPG